MLVSQQLGWGRFSARAFQHVIGTEVTSHCLGSSFRGACLGRASRRADSTSGVLSRGGLVVGHRGSAISISHDQVNDHPLITKKENK